MSVGPTRWHQLIRRGAPGDPALTCREHTLDYGELVRLTARATAGLTRLGLRPGERVLVYLDKRLETVVAMLAVSAAEAVLVPVNPVARAPQLAHIARDCAPSVLVTTPERWTALAGVRAGLTSIRHVVLVGGPPGPSVPDSAGPGPVGHGWAELVAADTDAMAPADPGPSAPSDPEQVAAIFYTSGSTGGPKGVVLTHANLLTGAASVAGYLEHRTQDVVLSVLPLSFDAGFSQLTTTFTVGAHVVLVNYLLPREVVRLCARHGVTALTCVPPLWWQLAEQEWPPASRGLRYFASTGGRMPRPVLDRLRTVFPTAAPYLMYGLTEAFRSTYLDPAQVDRRPDSIGRAIPGADVLVVGPDGVRCRPGQPGELVHRGPLVARGYWNDPTRTAERFGTYDGEPAVWSGDTVYRDEEGYLYFVGRTDDMIKTSGYRVSPSEIEDAAYATGLVAEALAFGVPDEVLGAHVVLAVSGPDDPPGGSAALGAALRAALRPLLPAYQVPRRVLVLDALPRSANGKFDRTAIREWAAAVTPDEPAVAPAGGSPVGSPVAARAA